MAEIENVIKAWNCCNPFNRKCKECPYEKDCYHDGISRHMVADAIELLKSQQAEIERMKAQKQKWLQNIADQQLAVSPTGYETEEELTKRTGEWNGLQMAWEIIAGKERSEHQMLVRCKDCKWNSGYGKGMYVCFCTCYKTGTPHKDDWFCADGERKEGE